MLDTMEETVAAVSAAEERFELWRARIGSFAGPILALMIYVFTPGLPPAQRRLGAILTLVIVYWISEAIPIPATALLGPVLCVLFGVGDAEKVFRSFGNPIIFVFLGGFLIARAMTATALDRRASLAVLRSRVIGSSPERVRIAMGLVSTVMSMWISNTATAAILLPIAIGIGNAFDRLYAGKGEEERRARGFVTGMLLMVAYGASIGGLGTPIGTPPNLIGIGMLERMAQRRITFFDWMTLGVPIVIVMFLLMVALTHFLHRPPSRRIEGLHEALVSIEKGVPAWGWPQTVALVSFLSAVALWVLPGVAAIAFGRDSGIFMFLEHRLQEGAVAVFAASLLFLLPVSWNPVRGVLSWREAVEIDWGTILLFGGGLSLGELLSETGLAARLAQGFLSLEGSRDLWVITAGAGLFSLLITETTSNTAAASMVVPLGIAVAQGAGVSPVPPALAATIGASLAFVLPVSTPPNAIAYGTGRVPILKMVRAGIGLDIICYLALLLLLRILCPRLGLL